MLKVNPGVVMVWLFGSVLVICSSPVGGGVGLGVGEGGSDGVGSGVGVAEGVGVGGGERVGLGGGVGVGVDDAKGAGTAALSSRTAAGAIARASRTRRHSRATPLPSRESGMRFSPTPDGGVRPSGRV